MTGRLEVDDLRVRFDTDEGAVLAVSGLSFSVAAGEVLALVGESGCGKSMTAMAIMGLLPPTANSTGSVRLEGRELTDLPPREMRAVRGKEISMIFQEPMTSLNPSLTVGYQLIEVLRRHEGLGRKEARRRAVELLDLVRMPAPRARVSEYPHQLSGGMRQRVMIAMAVACDPSVLLADEPTTALDVTIQAQILDILRDLRRELGTSIIVITHDLGVVADIARDVVVMYAGHAVESGPVESIFANPRHPYTVGLLGAVPRPDLGVGRDHGEEQRLREIPGLVPTLRKPPSTCVFAPRCARADDTCLTQLPVLEPAAPAPGPSVASTAAATGDAQQRVACFHPGADRAEAT